jgi:DNA modification methylase
MEINKIYNEDCLETMAKMPDNFIQSIITSPPYFNLRDYGNDKQIGIESNYVEYLNKLLQVFLECKRVLKKDGLMFINIGDSYNNSSLLGIPDRLKILLIDNGLICRNDIIWHKPNAIPQSAKNRFSNDYERILMFSKSNSYLFNTQYEKRLSGGNIKSKTLNNKSSKYENIEQESLVRQGFNKNRGSKIIEKRYNLPERLYFADFIKSKANAKFINSEHPEISLTKIEHWFRKDELGFSYPSVKDWNTIKYLIDDFSIEFMDIDEKINDITYESDDINKNQSENRIKRCVWSINTKPSKYSHFASYPLELIDIPIKCSTNENDLVYDPFMGSGTTAESCILNNRNYIGSEINLDYCRIAEKRVLHYKAQQKIYFI